MRRVLAIQVAQSKLPYQSLYTPLRCSTRMKAGNADIAGANICPCRRHHA
ncbi:MAG: hypothetical protein WAW41_17740 [Methylobacter sp.]